MNKGVITTLETTTEKGLIIEENTIYEIDEECMNCLNKEKNSNRNQVVYESKCHHIYIFEVKEIRKRR